MKIIKEKITLQELSEMSEKMFNSLVKAVIDIEKEIMVVDAELHADEYSFLIENGSNPKDLWGINLYPEKKDDEFVEFDSLINLRPSHGNKSRGVESKDIQEKIKKIVFKKFNYGL
ncbi:hypothetical protein COX24_03845 [bacterium (Candidatus Gribaldobacteria) CG23_combo_of_CG06-09_8_20_14_all_37_87_8]|uniref:Uncharacterized protein n=2 Tax=Candidatus Gribaldobacteria TaxID=2798536 RepID=A0A2G9ZDY4_9BACT|nr:MAG: hypothetical protein COX24_03845 [bacterium (Candidatus Gribaldobacteria) CG23_combo_of_CG06-09_8_20_14_all_37_87_8]PIR90416.1 MAG: hypothetical protein COU05_02110 [bacterium (Candidatus Gribaldobacteria) CG10_big_fil_rev_8_21_14_0_10_37_21]